MYSKDTIGVLSLGFEPAISTNSSSVTNMFIDAAAERGAVVFQLPKAMTINELGIYISTRPGAPTVTISLQSVDASGHPSGTVLGGGSPASTQWVVPGTGFRWATLDNSYAASKGEYVALVVEDGSTPSLGGGNGVYWQTHSAQTQDVSSPYRDFYNGTSWAKDTDERVQFGMRNSAALTDVIGYPMTTPTGGVSTSTDDEIVGFKFKIPASFGTSVKIHGIDFGSMSLPSTALVSAGIWANDSTPTEIIAEAYDTDCRATALGNLLIFFAETTLNTDTEYYVGLKKTGGTGSIQINTASMENDNARSAFAGYPDNSMSKFTGGAWSSSFSTRMVRKINLLVSDWTAGSAGGGAAGSLFNGIIS